jgi:hypothetical protein
MKSVVQKPNVVNQPPMVGPQALSDEQAINIMNRLRIKGAGQNNIYNLTVTFK